MSLFRKLYFLTNKNIINNQSYCSSVNNKKPLQPKYCFPCFQVYCIGLQETPIIFGHQLAFNHPKFNVKKGPIGGSDVAVLYVDEEPLKKPGVIAEKKLYPACLPTKDKKKRGIFAGKIISNVEFTNTLCLIKLQNSEHF